MKHFKIETDWKVECLKFKKERKKVPIESEKQEQIKK